MNYLQKTFWNMLFDSVTYSLQNAAKWNKYSMIAAIVEKLKNNENELRTASNVQGSKESSGQVNKKNVALATVGSKFSKLCSTLLFFAHVTKNHALETAAHYSDSMFAHDEEKDVLNKCNDVLKQARTYVNELGGYDVTTEQLDALEAELRAVEQMPADITMSTENQKEATRSIGAIVKESGTLLGQLDKAFHGMINDDAFLEGWEDVRKIKGRHKGKDKDDDNTDNTNITK